MAKEENLSGEKAKEEGGKPAANTDKPKALRVTMDKIEKNYGKGLITKLGDENIEDIKVIPTSSTALSVALDVGGYPKGRVAKIYGPESPGKTVIATRTIAKARGKGGIAAFIDAEHTFDRSYAEKLGVDVEDLWTFRLDNDEQALEIAEQLIRPSVVDITVIGSIVVLTPGAETESDTGGSKMGLQAHLMSQTLRKLTAAISRTNMTCIFINQLHDKIGLMFGNPETTIGGNASKFYTSVRLNIRSTRKLRDGDEIKGSQVYVKIMKNKVASPLRKAEFNVIFGQGTSRSGEIIDLGSELNIIKKSGSWYSYNDIKLGQDRDAAKQCVEDNSESTDELSELTLEVSKANK